MKSEEQIFTEAGAIQSPEAREAYLRAACSDNPNLRRRVDELLGDLQAADQISFLQTGTRPEETPALEKRPVGPGPGTMIGRYSIREQIGEGGCGIVYVAEQQEPVRRRVALKIIKPGMDSRAVISRFDAERQALAMMDHPNIAKVLDAGATDTGRPFFVMELVRGVNITDYCDRTKLSTTQRLELFIQVCSAVQHAHQKAIIHRDLKPSNILVTLHDGVPVPKVIDFGIAKALEGRLTDLTIYTQLHQFIGTPAYISPEQAEMSGLDIDTRSDIYSLGVLLYELLTGKTPFDPKELLEAGLNQMRRTLREKEPVRPSTRLQTMAEGELSTTAQQRCIEVPKLVRIMRGDLDWIVMKCLEKDRTRRYETANGLAADLKRHLANEPVVARPPSTGYRLQKTFRRNKLAFTATAAIVGALMLGIVVSTWQAIRATRAERSASAARLEADRQGRRFEMGESNAVAQLYSANLNGIEQAWELNNVGRVQELLKETARYPDRKFEWYYWQRQVHLELNTLRGHSGEVTALTFSPDGQRVVSGSDDQTARVWDAATGRELLILKGHNAAITSLAISPDGQRLATGSADHTAVLWEAATGKKLRALHGHSGAIKAIVISNDGQWIVTASSDRTVRVWDAATGDAVFTLKQPGSPIQTMAISRDGQRIATGNSDGTVTLWEPNSSKEALTFQAHRVLVESVAFSQDGQRIVTGSEDQTAKVWNVVTGEHVLTLPGHGAFVLSAAFSGDGTRIVTGSEDQTAKVWEAGSGTELFNFKGHTAPIKSVAFSPDGERIVTGSADQTIKIWDVTKEKQSRTLDGTTEVHAAAFSPDGQRIVTGSADKTVRVWETATGKPLLKLTNHSDCVCSAAFSPDGQRIVTCSWDRTARVWEAVTGKPLLIFKAHQAIVESAAFSPDGQRIASGGEDNRVRVWEATTGTELLRPLEHRGWVGSVAFSPDGARIISGSADGTAKVWEAATGKLLLTLTGHSINVRSVAFSPDGRRIVTSSYDRTAKVWDAITGQILVTLTGHGGWVLSASFSPDGQRIVTGSFDQTARVWQVASGKELLTLRPKANVTGSAAFSPDGQRIITGGGLAKVWEAASQEQIATWEEEEKAAAESMASQKRERSLY